MLSMSIFSLAQVLLSGQRPLQFENDQCTGLFKLFEDCSTHTVYHSNDVRRAWQKRQAKACCQAAKLLSSFALLRVFSSSSVSCHPDLHLFPGRPPVHPCLQTEAPLELCLPAGWPREGTDCRRRKKLHLAEGTLPFLNGRHGLKQKARRILVDSNHLLCA